MILVHGKFATMACPYRAWIFLGQVSTIFVLSWLRTTSSISARVGSPTRITGPGRGFFGFNGNYRIFLLCLFLTTSWIQNANVLDAVRIRDKTKVVLKKVRTWSEEISISLYLSSEELLLDPRNRSVRTLEVLPLPDDDSFAILVMPMLMEFSLLPFRRVGEFAEAVHQFLKVFLQFMTINIHTYLCIRASNLCMSIILPIG